MIKQKIVHQQSLYPILYLCHLQCHQNGWHRAAINVTKCTLMSLKLGFLQREMNLQTMTHGLKQTQWQTDLKTLRLEGARRPARPRSRRRDGG